MIYVIQVFKGKEKYYIDLISKLIDEKVLLDIFCPTKDRLVKYGGRWNIEKEFLFPGYIFVNTNYPNKLHSRLYDVPGFTKLVGYKKDDEMFFIPLSEDEEITIRKLIDEKEHNCSISDIELSEGNQVVVINGPLEGFQGQIIKLDLHKRLAIVELDMMGRKCNVPLGINLINKKV